jgi:hypothetical protein
MKVRHFGFMHASWAIPTDSRRLMILKRHDIAFKPPDLEAPAPVVASCPAGGQPMRVVLRLWTTNRAFVDTGCKGWLLAGASRCDTTRQQRRHSCVFISTAGSQERRTISSKQADKGAKASVASRPDGHIVPDHRV